MGEFDHLLVTAKMSLQKFCAILVKKSQESLVLCRRKMTVAFEGPLRQSTVSVASPLCIQPTTRYIASSDRAVIIQGHFSVIFFLSFFFFLFFFYLPFHYTPLLEILLGY